MTQLVTLSAGDSLLITAGKRTMTLKPSDLEGYKSSRGKRGNLLPKGYQKVDQVEVSAS
jgi:topoisomerase-4 subunit A